jgi:hypothetical protein
MGVARLSRMLPPSASILDDGNGTAVKQKGTMAETQNTPRVLSAGSIVGDRVKNRAGDDLGTIDELMIDMSGCVAYAVLSFGGFLGIGNKLFAIPWKALHMDPADRSFVLDADRDLLESAPGFDKDSWPDMADERWGAGIHAYYGVSPYWKDHPGHHRRAIG